MKPLIVANWKMNNTIDQGRELVSSMISKIDRSDREIVICPPYLGMNEISKLLFGSNVELGAQNMHEENQGAYTGEISAFMLKSVGCKYVIIGHSERRAMYESNILINKKIKLALSLGLYPIVCIGESLEDRNKNETEKIIKSQLLEGLAGVTGQVCIAYEPVWAIGTGKSATPHEVQIVHAAIKKICALGRVIYGGSVNSTNIKDLMNQKDVDGVLVGAASLNTESFIKIVNY